MMASNSLESSAEKCLDTEPGAYVRRVYVIDLRSIVT